MHAIHGYLLLGLLLYLKALASAQPEAAITSSLIYNTYLYSEDPGAFTCITRNSDDVRWFIDGVIHTRTSIRDRQIEVYIYATGVHLSQRSVIVIPATPVNQHIESIKCKAVTFYDDYDIAESVETAQFNVQGLLDRPPNISYSSYNMSHNLVEWLEPDTLNITNVEPDIESYTVCVNVTDECVNTTDTHFTFPKYSVDILVNVTAWNIVGESNNSTQLAIEACITYTPSSGQEYQVEVAFDDTSSTLLHLFLSNNQTSKGSPSTSHNDECLNEYRVTILQRNPWSTVSTQQLFGCHHSIVMRLPLSKNQLYTAFVNHVTPTAILPLNPVEFSTNDIQSVSVTLEGDLENTLQVTNHLAAGAVVRSLMVQLLVRENEIFQQRNSSVNQQCLISIQIRPCLVHTSFNLSSLITAGDLNLSVSISVSSWEESGPVNNVYFQEFTFELMTPDPIKNNVATTTSRTFNVTRENTTSNPEQNNTSTPTQSDGTSTPHIQGNNTSNSTQNNASATQTILVVISVVGAGGVLLGTVFLVCGLLSIGLRKYIKKWKGCRFYKDSCHLRAGNKAVLSVPNAVSLEMSHNDAYETSLKLSDKDTVESDLYEELHLYDEIPQPTIQR